MNRWKSGLCMMLSLVLALLCVPTAVSAAEPGVLAAADGLSPAATGDNTMLMPFIILLVLSAAGIAVLILILIKNRKK